MKLYDFLDELQKVAILEGNCEIAFCDNHGNEYADISGVVYNEENGRIEVDIED